MTANPFFMLKTLSVCKRNNYIVNKNNLQVQRLETEHNIKYIPQTRNNLKSLIASFHMNIKQYKTLKNTQFPVLIEAFSMDARKMCSSYTDASLSKQVEEERINKKNEEKNRGERFIPTVINIQ